MVRVKLNILFDEKYNNAYYMYSPWLIENVYSKESKSPWRWIYEDEVPVAIIFFHDTDALAFRLTFDL
jgi:hypothetical protein